MDELMFSILPLYLNEIKPDYLHGTVGNVMSMTISTVIVAAAISISAWF
jgi:hypothetical protein